MHTLHRLCTVCIAQNLPQVSIMRGSDGFGFTICCDCPVRVQDVDPSGPAHQSGLRQGDSVLQLNGIPVETWKCSELAHAIRSCPSNIVLVLWRGSPEVRSGGDVQRRSPTHNRVAGRKLYPLSSHSKHSHRRGRGLGVLGSLWRDRKEEEEEEEEEVEQQEEEEQYSSHTTTMKGTRVTSSNGDNYIILSPVNPGGQVMYPNRPRTLDRLYQTHPSRGHHLLHYMEEESSRGTLSSRTATLPPSGPLGSNGNYQNCTIVQSHRPHSGYATYITPHPKTLVFPVFVQPLDLCSPDKTLLMSEEMVLHQINQLPAKVTVLIYTDLLLLTREDVSGRCIVLRSPLYLNMLQLREVPSEPLHLYLLQSSTEGWRCLLSLEAFSIEQKIRVSLCLHDNIHLQLITMETGHTQKLSDRPTDPGQFDPLYSSPSPYSHLCDPLRPPSPSTCYPLSTPARPPSPAPYSSGSPFSTPSIPPPLPCPTHCRTVSSPSPSSSSSLSSPVWKERAEGEQEERQQGEGESASETSESVGGVRSPSHMEREQKEQFRSTALRRSLSEGFLLQEPRSPLFLSDSTIDCLTRPETFEPNQFSGPAPPLPSIQALRNQLTQEGGTLNNLLLLFNGTKGSECRNHHQRKKNNRTRVVDACNRLSFLRRRKNNSGYHGNSLEKALRNTRPCAEEVLKWAESLSALLANQYGVAVFRHFLRSEFSEENLDFWLAVEKLKRTSSLSKIAMLGKKIFEEFISTNAARQVNVDSSVRELTNQRLRAGISSTSFHLAQVQVFNLMETDSYPRFLMSSLYTQLANQSTQAACDLANPSKDG